jgi:hypothetical protein
MVFNTPFSQLSPHPYLLFFVFFPFIFHGAIDLHDSLVIFIAVMPLTLLTLRLSRCTPILQAI